MDHKKRALEELRNAGFHYPLGSLLVTTFEDALRDTERSARLAALQEIIAGIRRMKYADRGEGLEDMDPHCDDHPDYERAMLDEFAEEIIASIRRAAEAREGNV